jgi:hypothetical protein
VLEVEEHVCLPLAPTPDARNGKDAAANVE